MNWLLPPRQVPNTRLQCALCDGQLCPLQLGYFSAAGQSPKASHSFGLH